MVIDLQGSMFKLYDPEIATEEMADSDDLLILPLRHNFVLGICPI